MDHLAVLIDQLSQSATVQSAEAQLDAAYASDSNNTLIALATLGNTLPSSDNRAEALVLLKRYAFRAGEHGIKGWTLLEPQSQAAIRDELLKALVAGENRESAERHVACDLAGQIFMAMQSVDDSWPQLIDTALQATKQPSPHARETGYLVLSTLPDALLQHLSAGDGAVLDTIIEELVLPPKAAFATTAAFDAATALLSIWPDGLPKLWPSLIQTAAGLTDPEHVDVCLKAIIDLLPEPDVVEHLAKMAALQPLLNLCAERAAIASLDTDNRNSWIEIGVTIAESSPQLLSALGPQFYQPFVETCLKMITEIKDDPEWTQKPEEDEDSEEPHVTAESALDRLAQMLDEEVLLSLVLPPIQSLLKSTEWQHIYAGLSAIASVAEGCAIKLEEQADQVLQLLHPFFTHAHPRVRHAALYALAQLCSNLDGKLQTDYNEPVLTILINALADPETRLRAWACAAVVNFYDLVVEAAEGSSRKLSEQLYERLYKLATSDALVVQARALSAISRLANAYSMVAASNYDTLMPYLKSCLAAGGETVDFRQSAAMDCVAATAIAAGKTCFDKDAVEVYSLVVALYQRAAADEDKSTTLEALIALTTLTIVAPIQAVPLLPTIVAALLQEAQQKVNMEGNVTDDSDFELVEIGGQVIGVNGDQLQNIAQALDALHDLLESMREHMAPYAQQILDVAVPLLKFYFSDMVRKEACRLLAPILQVAKISGTGADDLKRLLNYCAAALIDAFGQEDDPHLVTAFYEDLGHVFSAAEGIELDQATAEQFVASIEAQLQKLSVRCEIRDGVQDDIDAVAEGEMTDEALLEANSTALRGFVAVNPSEHALQRLAKDLVLEVAVAPGSPAELEGVKRWAMRFTIDLVAKQGARVASIVVNALQLFYNGLESEDAETRRAAAFGVGSIAQHGQGGYDTFLARCLEPLGKSAASTMPDGELDILARDNVVAAIAKILRYAPPSPTLAYDADTLTASFVMSMPIKQDYDELEIAYGLLLDLIAKGHPAVNPATPAIASHAVKVLAFALHGDPLYNLPPECQQPIIDALSHYLASLDPSYRQSLPSEVLSQLS